MRAVASNSQEDVDGTMECPEALARRVEHIDAGCVGEPALLIDFCGNSVAQSAFARRLLTHAFLASR